MMILPGKKKTRRGKRRSGSQDKKALLAHLANAHAATTAGDHANAKRHAFAFIQALPPIQQAQAPAQAMPVNQVVSSADRLKSILAARQKSSTPAPMQQPS